VEVFAQRFQQEIQRIHGMRARLGREGGRVHPNRCAIGVPTVARLRKRLRCRVEPRATAL